MLIFASMASDYKTCIGIFSASIFIASIIPGTLNFDLKILERTTAVQHWGKWIREANDFCNVDIINDGVCPPNGGDDCSSLDIRKINNNSYGCNSAVEICSNNKNTALV